MTIPIPRPDKAGSRRAGLRLTAGLLCFACLLPFSAHADGVVDDLSEDLLNEKLAGGGLVWLTFTGVMDVTNIVLENVHVTLRATNGSAGFRAASTNRIFELRAGAQLHLDGLILEGGLAAGEAGADGDDSSDGRPGAPGEGGAVYVSAAATFSALGVSFRANSAVGGDGGQGGAGVFAGDGPGSGGRGGEARGGAIFSLGQVNLTNCNFDLNFARAGQGGAGGTPQTGQDGGDGADGAAAFGGAIYYAGAQSLNVMNCRFRTNYVNGSLGGTGQTAGGDLAVGGRIGRAGGGFGGAIAATGPVVIEGGSATAEFANNVATGADGIAGGTAAFDQDQANGGAGAFGAGGALWIHGGQLAVSRYVFRANAANGGKGAAAGTRAFSGDGGDGGDGGWAQGGAVFQTAGIATFQDCRFRVNKAVGSVGGFGGDPPSNLWQIGQDGTAGAAEGGALYWGSTNRLTLHNCTFDANDATGAEGLEGAPSLGFDAGRDGNPGGSARGGAFYHAAGGVGATNTTFNANAARGGPGGLGGDGATGGLGTDGGDGGTGGLAQGGAICVATPLSVTNSFEHCTLADNLTVGGEGGDPGEPGGTFSDPGHTGAPGAERGANLALSTGTLRLRNSLLTGTNAVFGFTPDPRFNLLTTNTTAVLQSLKDNGGWTFTMALVPTNNPAFDAADPTGAPDFDQRGQRRNLPGDLGAVERPLTAAATELSLAPSGAHFVVTWPSFLEVTHQLQVAPAVPSATWTTVTATRTGTVWMVTSTNRATNQFFRLRSTLNP